MTYVCFIIAKVQCQKLNIIGYFFSISYMSMHDLLKKKKYAKINKNQKDQNVLNMIASVYSRRCKNYRMYLKGDSLHQTIMIVCELEWFSHISNRHNMYTLIQSCDIFYTQHAIFFATPNTCASTMWIAITRFTCVNVCSLNCLDLFLKYKIG